MKNVFFSLTRSILIVTAVGKLAGAVKWHPGAEVVDPLLPFFTAKQLLLGAAVIELVLVVYLFCRHSDLEKARGVLWLSLLFGTYRLELWSIGFRGYCHCLGYWGSLLGLSEATADVLAKGLLLCMFSGACAILLPHALRSRLLSLPAEHASVPKL
jgi:hypothetical protein